MPDHRGVTANRGGVDGVGGDGDHDDDSGVVNVDGSDEGNCDDDDSV